MSLRVCKRPREGKKIYAGARRQNMSDVFVPEYYIADFQEDALKQVQNRIKQARVSNQEKYLQLVDEVGGDRSLLVYQGNDGPFAESVFLGVPISLETKVESDEKIPSVIKVNWRDGNGKVTEIAKATLDQTGDGVKVKVEFSARSLQPDEPAVEALTTMLRSLGLKPQERDEHSISALIESFSNPNTPFLFTKPRRQTKATRKDTKDEHPDWRRRPSFMKGKGPKPSSIFDSHDH